jgi:hypothetical protein
MKSENLSSGLGALAKWAVLDFDFGEYLQHDNCDVRLMFTNGTMLRGSYWRLIKDGRHILSSFDHGHKYGLPAPIDAKKKL